MVKWVKVDYFLFGGVRNGGQRETWAVKEGNDLTSGWGSGGESRGVGWQRWWESQA